MRSQPGRAVGAGPVLVALAMVLSACGGTGGGGGSRTPQFVLRPAGSSSQAGTLLVGVDPESIEANASDRVSVVARALDPTGRPLAGIGITFQASFPDVSFVGGSPATASPGLPAAESITDATGTAVVGLRAGSTAGRLAVQAFTSNVNLGLGGVVFLSITDAGFISGDLQVVPAQIDLEDPAPGAVLEFLVVGGRPFVAGAPYIVQNADSGIGVARVVFDDRYPVRIRYTVSGRQAGAHVFNVVDATGASASGTVMVAITRLAIAPTTASISVGQQAQFVVSGGAPPYACSAGAGSVSPASLGRGDRLTFSSEGIETTTTVTITCTDSSGQVVVATVEVEVADVRISPDSASLPSGGTQIFAVSGGTAPYTCAASGGTISAALIVTAGGTTVFTADTVDGPSTGTLACTDAGGKVAVATIQIESTEPRIIPDTAAVGSGQGQVFAVTDGEPPYTCSVSFGALSPTAIAARGGTTTYTAPIVGAPASAVMVCTDAIGQVANASITIAPPTPTPAPEPTPTPEPVETIVIRANPASVDGVSGGTSTITATVLDARNQPLPGVDVLFGIVGTPDNPLDRVPTIQPILARTDADGIAATALVVPSGTAPQFVVVRGSAVGVSGVASVGITSRTGVEAGPPAALNAALFKANGFGDNNDGSWVTVLSALVTDAAGNPVADGTRVEWSNVIPAGATVFSPTFTNGLPPCGIEPYETATGLAIVPQPGTALTCLIYPPDFAFDPGQVRVSVPGTAVFLDAPFLFPGPAAEPTPGGATPTPTPSPVPVSAIVVDASPPSIDGAVGGTTTVAATLLDGDNQPLPGVTVRFEIVGAGSDPSVPRPTLSPLLSISDGSGVATSILTVPPGSPAQFVVVRATARGTSGTGQIAVAVQGTGTGGAPANLTATLLKVGAYGDNNDGTYVAILSALVTDENGNPVADGTRLDWTGAMPVESSVASPTFTNTLPPCDVAPYESGTGLRLTPQPGNALTCFIYPARLGSAPGSVQVSVPGTALTATASFVLPETTPAPSPTPTPTP